MYRLQKRFAEQIDFINLNVDNPAVKATRLSFGMRNRSHYVLIDADQNIVAQWFGPIEDEAMVADIEEALASLEK